MELTPTLSTNKKAMEYIYIYIYIDIWPPYSKLYEANIMI